MFSCRFSSRKIIEESNTKMFETKKRLPLFIRFFYKYQIILKVDIKNRLTLNELNFLCWELCLRILGSNLFWSLHFIFTHPSYRLSLVEKSSVRKRKKPSVFSFFLAKNDVALAIFSSVSLFCSLLNIRKTRYRRF